MLYRWKMIRTISQDVGTFATSDNGAIKGAYYAEGSTLSGDGFAILVRKPPPDLRQNGLCRALAGLDQAPRAFK